MSKARVAFMAVVTAAALGVTAAVATGASVDLSIDKTESVDPATVGTEFQYTLAVSNAGPETASGVTVEDTLPAHLDLVATSPSQGSCNAKGRKVTCDLGTLASAGSASVILRVIPRRADRLVNTATVSTTDTDSTQGNNADTERTNVVERDLGECGGRKATIAGTPGNDQIHGTSKRDVIVALTGNDAIFGFGGNDLVCAHGGNDFLKGGPGSDVLRGGGGRDSLGGGPNDDTLWGGTGRDTCRGGPGRDSKHSCR